MANRSQVLAGALALAGLLSVGQARAYSVQNHERLTRRAVELLERCRARTAENVAPLPGQILAYYNARQDDALSKTGLWHFPKVSPTDACPGPFPACQLVIARSYEPWTDDIWRRVQAKLLPAQLYPAAGAALHYVQDLAVPAHAVPIFHPRGLWDMSDGFDDYEGWDNAHSGPARDELAAECALVDGIAAASSLREVLAQVRASTRQSLDERLALVRGGKPVEKTFALLWQAQGPGFGVYGCEGDFGERELRCDGERYQVAPGEYQRFAGRRARVAIRYSAATIALFEQRLLPCAGPRCAPTEDEEQWLPTRCRIGALSRAQGMR